MKNTMFQKMIEFFNKNIGGRVKEVDVLECLLESGFIVHNADGSYYTGSFNWYRQKLKKAGFIDYEQKKPEEIEVLKKIPTSLRPIDI